MTKLWRWDVLTPALKACGLAMFIFHAIGATRMPLNTTQQQVFHLGFAFILIYGFQLKKGKPLTNLLYLALLLASLVGLVYVFINEYALDYRAGLPTQPDLIVGIILITSVFVASYKGWGLILPGLVALGILYALFGSLLPGALAAPAHTFEYTVSTLSIGLSGIFGALLTISFLYIFLFIIFGQLLATSGATILISEVGKRLSQKISSGPVLTATAGSALVGTCTGSAMANVFLTGSFTIPMMKKAGIRPDFAGGVEALASTGGQVMPPVMGAAGFVIAYYIGIHYFDVVKAAWLPAFLYFIATGFGAHFYCKLSGIKAMAGERRQTLGTVLRKGAIFIVAITVLMILLAQRHSPSYAATFSIAAILAMIFVESLFTGELRSMWRNLWDSIAQGARTGADIGMSLALLGMFVQVFYTTGLGEKLGTVLFNLAGDNLLLGLVLLGMLALILGTGMPTTAAYIMAAMVAAPALIAQGLPPISAHMFIFYLAVFSLVSPPVAPASMAASKLTGESFFRTGVAALRLAWPVFIVPFAFVYRPELLLEGDTPWSSVLIFAIVTIAIIFLQSATWGFLMKRLTIWERGLSALGAAGLIYYIMAASNVVVLTAALALLALVTLIQFVSRRRIRETLAQ